MKKNYWIVNVPLIRDGYSFMVYCEADNEDEVINELASHKDLFQDEEDYNYINIEEVFEDDYNFFKNTLVKL